MARSYPLIGVFADRDTAEQAIQGLYRVGVDKDQISYSGHASSGGFMEGLKHLFSGTDDSDNTVVQDLVNLGVPEEQAQYYARQHREGHPVVAVNAAGHEQGVASVFRQAGGYTYSTQAGGNATGSNADRGAYATGAAGATDYTDRDTYATGDQTSNAETLRLREEQLQVQKHAERVGEVRLHKDVVEEQQQFTVPVSHEEVYVEQRPVSGGARFTDTPIGQDETISVPVNAEQLDVSKNTVETGEVRIGKRTVTENQQVNDTVRRERARLEQSGDVPPVQRNTDWENQSNP